MLKAQAVADLALMLTQVTAPDRAQDAIRRALRSSGLSNATHITDTDMHEMLAALAAEGGPIQDLAVQIAIYGVEESGGLDFAFDRPTDKNAA
jgi:hypothetical protein